MTVKDMIAFLSTMDPDATVVMSKDGEGNSFSPLSGLSDNSRWEPDSTWSGHAYHPADEEEYVADNGQDSWDEMERVVVLWPTN